MYVGLKNIKNLFLDYPHLLTSSDSVHCLTGWNKLKESPTPYFSHLLYVCESSEDLSEVPFVADMHILCIASTKDSFDDIQKRFPDDCSLLIVQCDDPADIHRILQIYYNTQCGAGFFGQTLLEFLSFGDSLQSAVDYSFRIFGNPVFVFDANYNLIAATWDVLEKIGFEDRVILNRGFTDEDFRMANRMNHIHEKVKKSELPIKAFNQELGYEQFYCAINTKKDLGHIVISALCKPFEPADEEMLLTFKKYIDLQLRQDSFIRSSRGFNYEYFLRDLLEGKISSDQGTRERMSYVQSDFSGNKYCMVIETARSTNTVNASQIRNMLESRFPNTKILIYNGQIIAIMSVPNNQLIPSEYIQKAKNFCKEHELFSGFSNCFNDILDLLEYYNQSLRAIELGCSVSNEPNMFCYEDYYLDHMNSVFLQKESSKAFCHPKMAFLLEYDKAHHSELAYTLYMYLANERNLVAAAEAMDMHRTSLVYRFKKISSLIGEDYGDYKERMYMILSYEMCTNKK